jgi:anaerobic magnesium-protoporphyrin IX monomethyl ester cyclase
MRWCRPVRGRILFVVKNLYTMERVGVMYVSAAARRRGWETDLVISDDTPYDRIRRRIVETSPDIVGFSVMTPEYPAIRVLAQRLHHDTDCFLLFGGPHPTFSQGMIREPWVHALVFGEGDISFPPFLEKLERGEDFTTTAGMHFHLDGNVVLNGPAPLAAELDSIPFPDRELMAKGNPRHRDYRSHIFFASRGCPYHCTYCFNHQYNSMFRHLGPPIRRRSVDNLLEEIGLTKSRYGTEFAYIDDDIFTLGSGDWLEEFAERFPREAGVPFYCNVHVKTVDEEKIRLLAKAGCRVICFGIETGDPTVSRHLLKRDISHREFLEVAGLLHHYRIQFITQNMLALPVESPLQVDLQTLELNIRCRPDLALSQLFFPLPGTELAAHAVEHGFLSSSPDIDSLPDRTNSYSALRFPDPKEKARVERLQKLFGLAVAFPFLSRLLPVLTRLPLDAFYGFLYAAWVGYTMRFRMERTRKSAGELLFLWESLRKSSLLRRRQKESRSEELRSEE